MENKRIINGTGEEEKIEESYGNIEIIGLIPNLLINGNNNRIAIKGNITNCKLNGDYCFIEILPPGILNTMIIKGNYNNIKAPIELDTIFNDDGQNNTINKDENNSNNSQMNQNNNSQNNNLIFNNPINSININNIPPPLSNNTFKQMSFNNINNNSHSPNNLNSRTMAFPPINNQLNQTQIIHNPNNNLFNNRSFYGNNLPNNNFNHMNPINPMNNPLSNPNTMINNSQTMMNLRNSNPHNMFPNNNFNYGMNNNMPMNMNTMNNFPHRINNFPPMPPQNPFNFPDPFNNYPRPLNMPFPNNNFNPNLSNSFFYQPSMNINNFNMNMTNPNVMNPVFPAMPPINMRNSTNPNTNINNSSNNDDNLGDLVLPKDGKNNVAKMQLFKELDEFQYKNKDKFSTKLIEEDCSICLINYKNASILKLLPCGHIFHKKCIKKWLVKNDKCPNCNYNLTKDIEERKEELEKNFYEEEHEDDKI